MPRKRETSNDDDVRFVADIKTNILAIVEQKKLIVSRVLDEAGVNRSYLANIKKGSAHSPGVAALRRIAHAVGEPLEVLLAPPDKRDALSRLLRNADSMDAAHRELYVALALMMGKPNADAQNGQ